MRKWGLTPHAPAGQPSSTTDAASDGTASGAGSGADTDHANADLDVSVRELLASSAHVGKTVRVAGRCLGYGKIVAEGTPPLTRSDWQLEDGGLAIYVSGPLPEGCSPTEGSQTVSTIYARVAQDTLRGFGNQEPKARRYLVRVERIGGISLPKPEGSRGARRGAAKKVLASFVRTRTFVRMRPDASSRPGRFSTARAVPSAPRPLAARDPAPAARNPASAARDPAPKFRNTSAPPPFLPGIPCDRGEGIAAGGEPQPERLGEHPGQRPRDRPPPYGSVPRRNTAPSSRAPC